VCGHHQGRRWHLGSLGSNTYTGQTTINAGKLSISSDGNLGTAPGSLDTDQLLIDGATATLRVTANTTIAANRGITVGASGGTIEVAPSTTTTVSSPITVNGALGKTGTGTLLVNGSSGGGTGTTADAVRAPWAAPACSPATR